MFGITNIYKVTGYIEKGYVLTPYVTVEKDVEKAFWLFVHLRQKAWIDAREGWRVDYEDPIIASGKIHNVFMSQDGLQPIEGELPVLSAPARRALKYMGVVGPSKAMIRAVRSMQERQRMAFDDLRLCFEGLNGPDDDMTEYDVAYALDAFAIWFDKAVCK